MANIEKISVSGTSYDVRDASAAHALTDIANAGNNITFTTPTIDDYSIAGTGVTVTSGIASGFTRSSYIYKSTSVWNSAVNANAFEFQMKFKINSYSSTSYANALLRVPNSNADNASPRFSFNITTSGGLRFRDSDSYVSSALSMGIDYWLKAVYTGGSTISIRLSTDGTSFTEIMTPSFTPNTSTASNVVVGMGKLGYETQFLGSIDLTETYIKDGNGNVIWAASAPAGKPYINATGGTVDQTYNSSSANAQSGVAINGAGFLRNLSTGTNSIDVNYAGTVNNSVTLGANATSAASAVTLGASARGNNYGISIGRMAGSAGATGNNAISIGNNSNTSATGTFGTAGTNSIAIGNFCGCTGNNAVAIGAGPTNANCNASAESSIQLGYGVNSTSSTFSVGFYNNGTPVNYQMLDSTGHVPVARLGATAGDTDKFLKGDGTWQAIQSPELADIARAGDNITFTNNATIDYETVGTGVTVTSAGVASGFNSSGYLQKGGFWGSLIGQTDFTFITKFKINSSGMRYLFTQGTANNDIQFYIAFQNTNLYSGISTNGAMHVANATNVISYGTDYWLKFDYSNERGGIDVYLSTDGVNWGSSIASGSATGQISNSSATALFIGGGSWSPLSNYALTDGSLDLSETYASVGGNEIWRAFISGDKTAINATVPIVTSVSSSSTDSQVPSAKLFYDTCGNITALINSL